MLIIDRKKKILELTIIFFFLYLIKLYLLQIYKINKIIFFYYIIISNLFR